jgi:hypothetical protein
MSNAGNITLTLTIAAVILPISPSPLKIASASAEQLKNVRAIAASEPIALYIRLCLWSQQRPAPVCREVPLTPGAAGPAFASMKACQEGQEEALRRWPGGRDQYSASLWRATATGSKKYGAARSTEVPGTASEPTLGQATDATRKRDTPSGHLDSEDSYMQEQAILAIRAEAESDHPV